MSESTEQADLLIRAVTAVGVFMAGLKGLASLLSLLTKGWNAIGKAHRWWRDRKIHRQLVDRWRRK